MWSLFPISIVRAVQLWWYSLKGLFDTRRQLKGRLLVFLSTPVLIVWQLLNWLGFLLDEVFFPAYRWTEVKQPLFILGPPRSGTTHLHRTLARDARYTTFRAWEGVFGLSVTGRKLYLLCRRVDRALGRPFGRLSGWLASGVGGSMEDIHSFGLNEAEEDFVCLLPASACFLLAIPFPQAEWLWRIVKFDTALRPNEKAALLSYYKACVKKHVYVAGSSRQYLAKNPSFSGMAEGLLSAFPDARILACHRDPLETVPSQLSSLRPFMAACGDPDVSPALRDRFIDLLRHDYVHLHDVATEHPDKVAFVDNTEMRMNPRASILAALAQVQLHAGEELLAWLDQQESSAPFRSSHLYSLDEFGLDTDMLVAAFAPVYERFEYTGNEAEADVADV